MKYLRVCGVWLLIGICLTAANTMKKEEVDKVIEDEITKKLGEDLLQSIERKFQMDLKKSVDMVLLKIRLLLQNGTTHIQDRLEELQGELGVMKRDAEDQLDVCLNSNQNLTVALAEKALHQMVVCGYALIGQDSSLAVKNVLVLKSMIKSELKPVEKGKAEVYELLKVCGHDHDSLKKVLKCVISKSPLIKSSMMTITSKLIDGVVDLTKLMAHGAMHEACLIEVIKTTEDEVFKLMKDIKSCVYFNGTSDVSGDIDKYMQENNATVIDGVQNRAEASVETTNINATNQVPQKPMDELPMKAILRRMLSDTSGVDKKLKSKLDKYKRDLGMEDGNKISSA